MENRFFLNAKNHEALYFKAFGIQYCIIARYDRELQPDAYAEVFSVIVS